MRISILGCGWLGMPLAEYLIQENHYVKGSTTSTEKLSVLQQKQIDPYLVKLTPKLEKATQVESFWNTNVLILNIPPGRGRDNIIDYHSKQIKAVGKAVAQSSINRVIFTSSTSVYPQKPGLVTEEDAIPGKAGRDSGNALLVAERILMDNHQFDTTVLRFGGLYGGERPPAKYMAGRKNLGKPNAPVNLIHRDDCIAIISKIIEEKITGEIFNAVCDGHPTRRDYYTAACRSLGLDLPSFNENEETGQHKVVSNEKLKQMLSHRFIHPEPLLPKPD